MINRRGWFTCFPHELADKFAIGNHAVYSDGKNKFVVTELMKFFNDNKTVILELSK